MEQPLKNFAVDVVVVVVGQHKHEEGQFHKGWIFAVEYIVVVEERQDLVVIVAVVDVVKAIKLIFLILMDEKVLNLESGWSRGFFCEKKQARGRKKCQGKD